MENAFTFLVQWMGVILSVILGVIIVISSNGSGITKAEKAIADDDVPGHYLVKNSMGSFWGGLLILIAGCVISYIIGYLGTGADTQQKQVLALVAEIILSLLTSIIFLFMARKSIVERVLVNGNEIQIHQSFGKPQTTTFDQIRTVKKNGGNTAATSDSIILRPTGSRRFTVTKSMKNYNLFASQVDRDVPLPNLTKKRTR